MATPWTNVGAMPSARSGCAAAADRARACSARGSREWSGKSTRRRPLRAATARDSPREDCGWCAPLNIPCSTAPGRRNRPRGRTPRHEHAEERRRPAEHPHGRGGRDPGRQPLENEGVGGVVRHEVKAVQTAPDHERPARAVPQAAEQHRDEEIAVAEQEAATVSAERDVEVIAQEQRERDVPAPPEFDDGGRSIWRVEIHGQQDAEHARETNRHVGVAREIEVELERIRERAGPCIRRGDAVLSRPAEDRRDETAEPSASTIFLNRPMAKIVSPTHRSVARKRNVSARSSCGMIW